MMIVNNCNTTVLLSHYQWKPWLCLTIANQNGALVWLSCIESRSNRLHDFKRGLHDYFTWLYKYGANKVKLFELMILNVRRISTDFVQWKVNFMIIICLFLEFLFQFHQSFSVILHWFCSIWNIWQHINSGVLYCSNKWKWFHTQLDRKGNIFNWFIL